MGSAAGQAAGLRRRIAARRQKEISSTELEAFRRAGSAVYEVCLLAEELRAAGRHPWDAGPADASLFLAVWNARVHQSLAAELLDSDACEDPATAGYVPAATYRQVWSLFQPVARWLTVARRAEANDDFWVGDEHDLPTGLPPMHSPRDAPRKHLRGILTAADVLDRLLEQELGSVVSAGPPPERFADGMRRVDELAAGAGVAALRAGAVAPAGQRRAAGSHRRAPVPRGGPGSPRRTVPVTARARAAVPVRRTSVAWPPRRAISAPLAAGIR